MSDDAAEGPIVSEIMSPAWPQLLVLTDNCALQFDGSLPHGLAKLQYVDVSSFVATMRACRNYGHVLGSLDFLR